MSKKIEIRDLEDIREKVLDLYLTTPMPLYLNQMSIAEKNNLALFYMQATVDLLERKNLLKEKVEFQTGRLPVEPIEE